MPNTTKTTAGLAPGFPVEVQSPAKTLRCGVIGVGRMGRHHARVYSEIPGCELVGVVDANEEQRNDIAKQRGCKGYAEEAELLAAGVDAVSIAVPTTAHLKVARPFLEAGVACLIEKPLAPNAEESKELARLANEHGACLQVGHIERFNPVVRALRAEQDKDIPEGAEQSITPRFMEVHRVSPMTFRSLDVSVVFDMMIHDLDLVLMLMGGVEPTEVQATGVSVLTEHADICNARLVFDRPEGRCVATITASRLAMKTERKARLIAPDAYVSIDYAKKAGVLIRKKANAQTLDEVRNRLEEGQDLSSLNYMDLVAVEQLTIDEAEPLRMQLESFVHAIRTGEKPEVDADAGFAAVRTAERIIAAIEKVG